MRRVYRAPGRGRDPHLRAAGRGGRGQTRDDHRGAVAQPEPRGAEGVDRRGRAAVRLLSIGPDHGRGGTAGEKPPPERRGHRRGDDEHLPLRDLTADPLRHSPRRAGGVTMSARTDVTRREFLETAGAAGAGLVVSFHLPLGPRFRPTTADPFAPNAWIRINPDDSVLIVVDRSEMGQGVTTSLPMLLAEELEADWSKIKIEFAPADKAYINPMFGMQGTGGSTSVRAAYTPLRKAGAAARSWRTATGQPRGAGTRSPSHGTRARTRPSRARASRSCSRNGPSRRVPWRVTTGTPTRGSRPLRRSSRRCTSCRSSPTPPWSR